MNRKHNGTTDATNPMHYSTASSKLPLKNRQALTGVQRQRSSAKVTKGVYNASQGPVTTTVSKGQHIQESNHRRRSSVQRSCSVETVERAVARSKSNPGHNSRSPGRAKSSRSNNLDRQYENMLHSTEGFGISPTTCSPTKTAKTNQSLKLFP